jgi:hypothetical protein
MDVAAGWTVVIARPRRGLGYERVFLSPPLMDHIQASTRPMRGKSI